MTTFRYYPKGTKLPRNREGTKKGAYPARVPVQGKQGLAEGHHGVVGKTKDGFVQGRYCMPLGGKVSHDRKTGKPYTSVHHKWGGGAKSKSGKGSKSRPRPDQHEVFGVTPQGRVWAMDCSLEERHPKAREE